MLDTIRHSLPQLALDWAAPLGTITLGTLMLDAHAYLVAKEVVVILSLAIGILTNGIRLYRDWKNKGKDKQE